MRLGVAGHVSPDEGRERETGVSDAVPAESVGPILVVDDDPMSCRMMASALELEGYQVQWAVDPLRALELLRGVRYALLITDVNMPRLLGTELAAEAARIQPGLRTLLVTAFGDARVRAEAKTLGAAILAKPLRIEALGAEVRDLLARPAARRGVS
jgi:DNA-binding response OmpR family regulator